MQTSTGVSTKISMKFLRSDQLAYHAALGPERRDERAQHEQSGINHQSGDLAAAADVLDPVEIGEAEVAVESSPQVVAIERISVHAPLCEPLLDEVEDGGLAGAGQTGEPQDAGALRLHVGTERLVDPEALLAHVARALQGKRHHARRDRASADPIDQDEGAGRAVVRVRIERERRGRREIAELISGTRVAASAPVDTSILCLSAVTEAAAVCVPSRNV
jgi:hypothetical protein